MAAEEKQKKAKKTKAAPKEKKPKLRAYKGDGKYRIKLLDKKGKDQKIRNMLMIKED